MSQAITKRNPVKMNRRQFLRYTVVGGSAAAFMAACAVPEQPAADSGATTSDAPAGDAAPAVSGGTMTWMGHQEVAGLAPDDLGPTVHEVIIYNVYNPLVYYNEWAELENVLADSFEMSEDGLTYTFKLKEGVLFQNGEELTSADVKYTYDFYRDPEFGSSSAGLFTGIDSIDTPDDYTVVVNMSEVNAASLANWGAFPVANAAYMEEVGHEGNRVAPIGTGPYMVSDFNPAEFVELHAFDDHFRGRPNIDVLRQEVVPEPSVRYIALSSGEAESAVWPLLVEDSIELEGDPDNFVVYRTLANSVKHFPLNNSLPQLAEKEVRQAMMYALDRQRLIDELWNGAAQVAHSNLAPKNTFYYNPNLKQYDYNPETAMEMLDAAGWVVGDDGIREKDGVQLSFTCTTITGDQARRPIAELAQLMLKEVGVDMQLAEAPVASILEGLRNGTMDCSLFNWTYGSTPEPDPFSTLHSEGGNNFCQFNNARMDELIAQGTALADPEQRKPIYAEIQEIFVEEVPCLYLQFDEWMNVFSTRIEGLPEAPLSGDPIYFSAYEWTLGDS